MNQQKIEAKEENTNDVKNVCKMEKNNHTALGNGVGCWVCGLEKNKSSENLTEIKGKYNNWK